MTDALREQMTTLRAFLAALQYYAEDEIAAQVRAMEIDHRGGRFMAVWREPGLRDVVAFSGSYESMLVWLHAVERDNENLARDRQETDRSAA